MLSAYRPVNYSIQTSRDLDSEEMEVDTKKYVKYNLQNIMCISILQECTHTNAHKNVLELADCLSMTNLPRPEPYILGPNNYHVLPRIKRFPTLQYNL